MRIDSVKDRSSRQAPSMVSVKESPAAALVSNPQVMLPRCKMPGSEISSFPPSAVKKTRPRRQSYPRVPLHPSADTHRFSSPAGVWVRSAHVMSASAMPVRIRRFWTCGRRERA
jgi:hypothetical protein